MPGIQWALNKEFVLFRRQDVTTAQLAWTEPAVELVQLSWVIPESLWGPFTSQGAESQMTEYIQVFEIIF